jgi:hypothetical protein
LRFAQPLFNVFPDYASPSLYPDLQELQCAFEPFLLWMLYDLSTLTPIASMSSSVLSLGETCSILESIDVGLIGAKLPFLSFVKSNLEDGAVDALSWLPTALRWSEPCRAELDPERFERSSVDVSWSIAMLAHREERGSKSATMVNASVPASGNPLTVTYSRIAKMADCGLALFRSLQRWKAEILTRNDHRTATHCSKNSDAAPLLPTMATAVVQSVQEFSCEDQGEEPDRDSFSY